MQCKIDGTLKDKRMFEPKEEGGRRAYKITVVEMGMTHQLYVEADTYEQLPEVGEAVSLVGLLEPAREGKGYVIERGSLTVSVASSRRTRPAAA